MPKRKHVAAQQPLPFGAAEGSFDERERTLANALKLLHAQYPRQVDFHLCQFVWRVFHTTSGGVSGEYRKSYSQLMQAPFDFACSKAKVRDMVESAEDFGLVCVHRNRYVSGSRQANGFTINWPMVRAVARGDLPRAPGEHTRAPGEHTRAPGEHTRAPQAQVVFIPSCTSLKTTTSKSSLRGDSSPAEADSSAWKEAEAVLRECGLRETANASADARRHGLTPRAVIDLATYYRANADRWDGIGALHFRVRTGSPADAADEKWPKPSEVWLASERARASAQHDANERARDAERSATEATRRQQGEQADAAGKALLQSLAPEQLAALVERASQEAYWPAPSWRAYGLESLSCRCALLRLLQQTETEVSPTEVSS